MYNASGSSFADADDDRLSYSGNNDTVDLAATPIAKFETSRSSLKQGTWVVRVNARRQYSTCC